MKKIYSLLLILTLGLTSALLVEAQEASLGRYTSGSMVRTDDGKGLKLHFVVESVGALARQQVVYIRPTLVSADGERSVALDPICIAGKGRYKVIHRAQTLKNKMSLPEAAQTARLDQLPLEVTQTIPFDRWMSRGHLVLREEVYGCAECQGQQLQASLELEPLQFFSERDYRYDFIEPEGVAQKSFEEKFESKVNFVVARHKLQIDYKENAAELDRMDAFVKRLLALRGAEVEQVRVEGYASPEAEFNYNKSLSERRAETLARYVRDKYPKLGQVTSFEVEGVGEDWAGLRAAVEASEESWRDEVLRIIDAYDTDLQREAQLKELEEGVVYRQLLDNYYPALRRTTLRAGYKVRAFSIEELPEVYAETPQLMSNRELYLLAHSYDKAGDARALEVYETAYNLYKEDTIARLNYANALLKYKRDGATALSLLQTMKEDARAQLPMAIAYQLLGNDDVAEQIYYSIPQ